jgi:hypothetical protein
MAIPHLRMHASVEIGGAWRASVKGHLFLPTGGHGTCPRADMNVPVGGHETAHRVAQISGVVPVPARA